MSTPTISDSRIAKRASRCCFSLFPVETWTGRSVTAYFPIRISQDFEPSLRLTSILSFCVFQGEHHPNHRFFSLIARSGGGGRFVKRNRKQRIFLYTKHRETFELRSASHMRLRAAATPHSRTGEGSNLRRPPSPVDARTKSKSTQWVAAVKPSRVLRLHLYEGIDSYLLLIPLCRFPLY